MRYQYNKAMATFCYFISDRTAGPVSNGWWEAGSHFYMRARASKVRSAAQNHPSNGL